ncbi:MAG: glycoside hydrolase family 3 N-terminal domain-containing protein, partial [Flavobacteriales bacterium]
MIEKYHIGGLIFFQGGPRRQIQLVNQYQNLSKTPLLISQDAEWGLSMRLDSTMSFPKQMTLGAIQNDSLIREMGKAIAKQCKRVGVHVNLAPVVDVNNNRNNPVINYRSFGENRKNVASKGIAYMKGLQDMRVLANAKHFPGHGDTEYDSHKTLPEIDHSKRRLDSIELYPFKRLIENGLGSIMAAHLSVPALDSTKNRPITLSPKAINKLLKEKIGFSGLVFTDALNMKGVTENYDNDKINTKALKAGNDVLLFPQNVPSAIKQIKKLVEKGAIKEKTINKKCKKILQVKHWTGARFRDSISLEHLHADLHSRKDQSLKRKLIAKALTLLKNKNNTVPIKKLNNKKIASVLVGGKLNNEFQKALKEYIPKIDLFSVSKASTTQQINHLKEKLKGADQVILSIHNTNNIPSQNYKTGKNTDKIIEALGKEFNLLVDYFGNPYGIKSINKVKKYINSLIVSYEDKKLYHHYSADLILGGLAAKGKLPVTISKDLKEGEGVVQDSAIRLRESLPEETGINSHQLKKIDKIIQEGIKEKAFPGCQIFIAKDKKVIYNRAYGYHTYKKKKKVKKSDIYDLASITKIVSTTASLMKLQDRGLFHMDSTLSDYLPELVDSTDYEDVVLRDILAHQAGFVSWIPFYLKTLHENHPKYTIYSKDSSDLYNTKVAENFYINKHYRDSIFDMILSKEVDDEKEYKYSDVGYYFFKRIIEKITDTNLNAYVKTNFYDPLGLETMGYLPLKRFPKERIVPTEKDTKFRKQLINGYVHDPGAAMLGGVAGHAGIFSNARDLGVMLQMYLNNGSYGGKRYISKRTLKEYTKCQFCKDSENTDNRRGAGFDKPVREGSNGPTCDCVSYLSFGHTGFTGTMAWADPGQDIVYV